MLVTKENLNAMRRCKTLTLVRKADGYTYLLCKDIEVKSIDAKINKEYIIETHNKYPKLYDCYYVNQQSNIRTMLSFLKVNDNIRTNIVDCPMDDNINLIEIHLIVDRNNKNYDFLLSVTMERYL